MNESRLDQHCCETEHCVKVLKEELLSQGLIQSDTDKSFDGRDAMFETFDQHKTDSRAEIEPLFGCSNEMIHDVKQEPLNVECEYVGTTQSPVPGGDRRCLRDFNVVELVKESSPQERIHSDRYGDKSDEYVSVKPETFDHTCNNVRARKHIFEDHSKGIRSVQFDDVKCETGDQQTEVSETDQDSLCSARVSDTVTDTLEQKPVIIKCKGSADVNTVLLEDEQCCGTVVGVVVQKDLSSGEHSDCDKSVGDVEVKCEPPDQIQSVTTASQESFCGYGVSNYNMIHSRLHGYSYCDNSFNGVDIRCETIDEEADSPTSQESRCENARIDIPVGNDLSESSADDRIVDNEQSTSNKYVAVGVVVQKDLSSGGHSDCDKSVADVEVKCEATDEIQSVTTASQESFFGYGVNNTTLQDYSYCDKSFNGVNIKYKTFDQEADNSSTNHEPLCDNTTRDIPVRNDLTGSCTDDRVMDNQQSRIKNRKLRRSKRQKCKGAVSEKMFSESSRIDNHMGKKQYASNVTEKSRLQTHTSACKCTVCPKSLCQSSETRVCSSNGKKSHTRSQTRKIHTSVHNGKRPHICTVCGKSFKLRGHLKIHMSVHSGTKPYSCTVCGKSFKQSSGVKEHMSVHSGEKRYSCTVCGKSFRLRGDVKIHMLVHSEKKPYSCTVCGKSFKQSSSVNLHMSVHTGEKPYSCTVCGKSFKQRGSVKLHMSVHSEKKPYSCTVCGKSFTQTGNLKVHMSVHSGEKPYSCTVCGKSFRLRGALKIHMSVHSGEKRYSCTVCGKSFKQSGSLKVHMSVHSGEKPYSCTVCGKSFRLRGPLKIHMSHVCTQ